MQVEEEVSRLAWEERQCWCSRYLRLDDGNNDDDDQDHNADTDDDPPLHVLPPVRQGVLQN
jgi:hypothetical protein